VTSVAVFMSADSPNVIRVAWSMVRAMRVSRPRPAGDGRVPHAGLGEILTVLQERGIPGLSGQRAALRDYRRELERIDPDRLSRDAALAFWLNLYNAGALDVAAEAVASSHPTVLRVPGAFTRPWATIARETLSLDDIEHGKARRFGDPRIHAALVCGSASCPTLRYEPYRGEDLDDQLEDQMRRFLAAGGAVYDGKTDRLTLSRIFLWYGADFVRPHRMPSWVPVRRQAVAAALTPWLDRDEVHRAAGAGVDFRPYDWALACSIG
jgi:hypothetical protein